MPDKCHCIRKAVESNSEYLVKLFCAPEYYLEQVCFDMNGGNYSFVSEIFIHISMNNQ